MQEACRREEYQSKKEGLSDRRNQGLQGLVPCVKDVGLFPESNGKSLKSFKQGNERITFALHFIFTAVL